MVHNIVYNVDSPYVEKFQWPCDGLKISAYCSDSKEHCLHPKNSVCKIYHLLSASVLNRKRVGLYHADISMQNKAFTHHEFSRADSDLKCLVATITYGLVCVISECGK